LKEEHLYAQAADEALARAQELSMMLTGEPLSPRLQIATPPPGSGNGRGAFLRDTPVEATVLTRRSGFRTGWRLGQRSGPDGEPGGFWANYGVPLVVFAGLLIAIGVTTGDATRALLALGAVAVAVLIVAIPAVSRRDPSPVDPVAAKSVLDAMAGVIVALRPTDDPGDGAGERREEATVGGSAGGTTRRDVPYSGRT
jgi:hypothetical protein